MKVYIEKENKYKNLSVKTVKELLDKLKINPTTVLVVVNDALVSEETNLNNKDRIKIISVVSGG
jgi:thiamine biosynthesis protein ThiS